ncbi:hypothetical protein ACFSLT_26830 [Novosphingobium resinovorum]
MREGESERTGDPGLYDYVPYRGRKPFAWPGGKKVAVWISPTSNSTSLIRLPTRTASRGPSRIRTSSAIPTATTPTASATGAWPT